MRYKELDGLRGLAALSVFLSHIIGVFEINSVVFDSLYNSPFHIFWNGQSAVVLFFLLSGFVLTMPYISNRNELNLPSFYFKRIFRIYPVYIFSIVFCIFLKLFLFGKSDLIGYSSWINEFWKWDLLEIPNSEFYNTFVLVGIPFDFKLFNPVIWTLRIEMLVSFILPFLIFVALRLKIIINLVILLFFFYLGEGLIGVFYFGIILAVFRNDILQYINLVTTKFLSLSLFLIATFLYTNQFSLNFLVTLNDKCILILSTLGSALFLFLSLKTGFFSFLLNTRIIQFLGKISFSLYLFHFPILMIVCLFVPANFYIVFSVAFSGTLIFSYFINKFIEIPFMHFGRAPYLKKIDFIANNFIFKIKTGILQSKVFNFELFKIIGSYLKTQ